MEEKELTHLSDNICGVFNGTANITQQCWAE